MCLQWVLILWHSTQIVFLFSFGPLCHQTINIVFIDLILIMNTCKLYSVKYVLKRVPKSVIGVNLGANFTSQSKLVLFLCLISILNNWLLSFINLNQGFRLGSSFSNLGEKISKGANFKSWRWTYTRYSRVADEREKISLRGIISNSEIYTRYSGVENEKRGLRGNSFFKLSKWDDLIKRD